MDHYEFVTGDQLKEILKEVPDDREIQTLTFDFESESLYSEKSEEITKDDIYELGEQAQSIVFTGNEYLSQLNMYSVRQNNLYDIRPEGILKIVMLGTFKLPQNTYCK